ncbi:MAG TPA: hypothetical protein VHP62_01940 [Usitatibacter sp.]|jgi:hypothetical protein|nr:hypothetical protein [Usitatibacter sp.]
MKRPRTLSARWSKAREHGVSRINGQQGDILYEWGDGVGHADGHLLHYALGCERMRLASSAEQAASGLVWDFAPSFLQELHDRGYDLTTLRFSIQKRQSVTATDTDSRPASPSAPHAHSD